MTRRKTSKSARSRSKSPRRGGRAASGSRRRAVRLSDEVDSESSSSLEIAGRGHISREKTSANYPLSTGLDSDSGG